jgi:hypothetical protein
VAAEEVAVHLGSEPPKEPRKAKTPKGAPLAAPHPAPAHDEHEFILVEKRDERLTSFAILMLGGVGSAFFLAFTGYLVLVLTDHLEAASVFADLMKGVIPTLAGTIAGYILNERHRALPKQK